MSGIPLLVEVSDRTNIIRREQFAYSDKDVKASGIDFVTSRITADNKECALTYIGDFSHM